MGHTATEGSCNWPQTSKSFASLRSARDDNICCDPKCQPSQKSSTASLTQQLLQHLLAAAKYGGNCPPGEKHVTDLSDPAQRQLVCKMVPYQRSRDIVPHLRAHAMGVPPVRKRAPQLLIAKMTV